MFGWTKGDSASRWLRRLRVGGVAVGLVVAIWILLASVHGHYPIRHWLFWLYLQYWLFALAFVLVCLSSGLLVVRALGPRHLPLLERLVFSMAVGVLVFFTVMFLGGLAKLYGPVFAIAMPVLLFASGAWPLFVELRRARRHLAGARRRARRVSVWHGLAAALGLVGLVMVYVTILTPDNAAYDSRWYHLALPEHYVAAGGITRFPEGWTQGALPQLASVLYVWPYQFPWLGLFHQVEIAAHIEFVLFLATLAAVPVLVRWLVPGSRALVSWAAVFLFSSIFVYDAALTLASDHIAAFWAIPIFLALRRAWRALEPRACLLLGAMLAGAVLTKYQSLAILAFPCAAIVVRAVWLLARRVRGRAEAEPRWHFLTGPALAVGGVLLLTAVHWLKNWVWYGDPLYPVLHGHLTLRPWHEDADQLYRTLVERHFWRPTGTPLEKAKATFEALFTFSFRPHDWQHFHGTWPVFGFLFTLTWPVMPFVGTRRVWTLFIAAHVGLVVWFLFSHQDRYLQVVMPWMVAHVAAVIVLVWRMGWLARVPLLALLCLQIVWSVGVYFVPSHIFMRNRLQRISELLSSGYRKDYRDRFKTFDSIRTIGRAMPTDAHVLLHRFEGHAGLQRRSVTDHPSWQGLISYGRLASHRAVYDLFSELGVTHVVWVEDDWLSEDSLGGDLRFSGFVTHVLEGEQRVGGAVMARMPAAPPADDVADTVLYLGCRGYAPGLYDLDTMVVPGMDPPPGTRYPEPVRGLGPTEAPLLLEQANYLVTDPKCAGRPSVRADAFVRRASRKGEQLMVRRDPLRVER